MREQGRVESSTTAQQKNVASQLTFEFWNVALQYHSFMQLCDY